jgi:hypothetical protein
MKTYIVYDPKMEGQVVKRCRVAPPNFEAWEASVKTKGWEYIEGGGQGRGYVEDGTHYPLKKFTITIQESGDSFTLHGVPDGAHVFVNGYRYTEPPWVFPHDPGHKTVIQIKRYRYELWMRSIEHALCGIEHRPAPEEDITEQRVKA